MELQCNLCNSADIEIVFRPRLKNKVKVEKAGFTPTGSDFGIFYDLARCRNCNILFSLRDNKRESIERLYSDSKDDLYLSQAAQRSRAYKKILSHIRNFVPGNARLLDIGCSYGLFLKLAEESGFQAYGVEVSEDACRYCKDTLGLKVSCQDVRQADFPEGYFDVITALEVIEHLQDPRGFITRIRQILKPGGFLYLVTPDMQSFSARLLGYRWWSYRKMHLYYFSKNTLCDFLVKNGFSILDRNPYKKTFKIDYIIHQLYNSGYAKMFYYILSAMSNILKAKDLSVAASFGDIAVTARKLPSPPTADSAIT